MKSLEESIDAKSVEKKHFAAALKLITPRTPASLLKIYEEYLSKS